MVQPNPLSDKPIHFNKLRDSILLHYSNTHTGNNMRDTIFPTRREHCFLAVAKHLSFTKASIELGITQPAVTSQIKQLELSLNDSPVFTREHSRVALTSLGSTLLKFYTMRKVQSDMFYKTLLDEINSDDKTYTFTELGKEARACVIRRIRENLPSLVLVETIPTGQRYTVIGDSVK